MTKKKRRRLCIAAILALGIVLLLPVRTVQAYEKKTIYNSPSIMSRASDSRFAICKKQNSGVLIKKPSPASTNDLSGRTEQKLLSTAGVLVRTSTLPTSVHRGRVHPAGRQFP